MVSVTASVTTKALTPLGEIEPKVPTLAKIQALKDDVLQPQAVAETSVTSSTIENLSFTTLVQVPNNNCKCNVCSTPVVLDILNAGDTVFYKNIDVVVTKLV